MGAGLTKIALWPGLLGGGALFVSVLFAQADSVAVLRVEVTTTAFQAHISLSQTALLSSFMVNLDELGKHPTFTSKITFLRVFKLKMTDASEKLRFEFSPFLKTDLILQNFMINWIHIIV